MLVGLTAVRRSFCKSLRWSHDDDDESASPPSETPRLMRFSLLVTGSVRLSSSVLTLRSIKESDLRTGSRDIVMAVVDARGLLRW